MTATPQLAGIDVSAQTLVVCIESRLVPDPLSFPNTPAGHRRLIKRLTKNGRHARIALEATGLYSLDLALALQAAARIELMVVNPRALRDFAKALLRRSKTDPEDATALLEYVRRMPFQPWVPPRPEALHLRALARRIAALVKARSRERNRLHAATSCLALPPELRNDIEVNIRHLDRRVQRLEALAIDLVWQHTDLRKQMTHLTSIRGIARSSAIQILAELTVLPQDMTVRQWVAHSGLDPRAFESGVSVSKPARISRVGNEYLRSALFMPALVAARHEPHVKAFYEALIARGKKPKQAVVAVMRKLLHSIYGMLKHGCDFDGELFRALP